MGPTMAEWFGLREGLHNFMIENEAHASLLFARQELDEKLQAILRKAFRTESPPKFVLYGDWGVGKTHTMRHVEYDIENNPGYPAITIFAELPDVGSKSTFQVAHAAMLDALGFEKAQQWMAAYQAKHQQQTLSLIQAETQSGDIARAFATLPTFGDAARTAWDWLRGISLSAADARSVGLPPVLEQSLAMATVLRMMGRLARDIEDQMLVFMLDEATKVENVTNADAIRHWTNAFKVLADDLTKEIGFVVSLSFRDPDDMPEPLRDQQVRTRFGEEQYIRLDNFDLSATREFVVALLDQWIDPVARKTLSTEFAAEAEGEEIECFPLTKEGLEIFVEFACKDGGISNPRDAQKKLDDTLNSAIDDGRHVVSGTYLSAAVGGY